MAAGVLLWPLPLELARAVPGSPSAPGVADRLSGWLAVDLHGPRMEALVHTGDVNFPLGEDQVARHGYPVEAALMLPLLRVAGWPAGVGLAAWAWLALAGAAAAVLARRWTGARAAGAVGAVAWQASSVLAMDVSEARLGMVAAAAMLPLFLLLALLALQRGGIARSVLAGCAGGLVLTTDLQAGLDAVVLLLPLLVLAGCAGRWADLWTLLAGGAAGALLVAGLPLGWAAVDLVAPDAALGAASRVATAAMAEGWDALAGGGLVGTPPAALAGRLPGPVVVALALTALVRRAPRRRVGLPVLWVGLGVLLALGAGLEVAGRRVALPAAGLAPLLGWGVRIVPARFLLVAELGLALLAAEAVVALAAPNRSSPAGRLRAAARARRLPAAVAGLVVLGGFLHPQRPVARTPWLAPATPPGDDPHQPLLLLPYPDDPGGGAVRSLLRQAVHRRPLVTGRRPPWSRGDVDPVTVRLHARFPALDALARAGEPGAEPLGRPALVDLRRAGIDAIVVDREALAPEARDPLLRSLGEVLGPEAIDEQGSFVRVALP